VIKTAAKSKQLNKQEVQPSLKQLQKLVEQDPPIIPALVAQALVYEQEQEFKAAEELYRKALDSTPPKGKPSLLARVVSRLKERLSSADTDAITEKKIIVEDKDTELDMAAAHLGLAEIQYYRTYDYENALKNWEIAALNYDDPEAYYKITQHLEAVAKNDNKDLLDDNDPVEHNCLRFVPYKWYEYMMKAAASGHAEACYKIGLFLMLARRGYSKQITDRRLRNALANSPLMKQSPWPARVGNPEKYSEERNQVHVIDRWFSAACQLGYTPAEISLALLWLDQKSTPLSPESHVRNVLWIATRGRFVDMQSEDMQLSMNDQEKAIKLYKWLIRTERVQTIVRDAKMTSPKERSLNQRDIIECLKKLPRSIQQL
jgi:tetratricopeptide (TPR) repeat protein